MAQKGFDRGRQNPYGTYTKAGAKAGKAVFDKLKENKSKGGKKK